MSVDGWVNTLITCYISFHILLHHSYILVHRRVRRPESWPDKLRANIHYGGSHKCNSFISLCSFVRNIPITGVKTVGLPKPTKHDRMNAQNAKKAVDRKTSLEEVKRISANMQGLGMDQEGKKTRFCQII